MLTDSLSSETILCTVVERVLIIDIVLQITFSMLKCLTKLLPNHCVLRLLPAQAQACQTLVLKFLHSVLTENLNNKIRYTYYCDFTIFFRQLFRKKTNEKYLQNILHTPGLDFRNTVYSLSTVLFYLSFSASYYIVKGYSLRLRDSISSQRIVFQLLLFYINEIGQWPTFVCLQQVQWMRL